MYLATLLMVVVGVRGSDDWVAGRRVRQGPLEIEVFDNISEPAECNELCLSHTGGVQQSCDCEAWTLGSQNKCRLYQISGAGKIGPLGDLSGNSWKRHSNFRGDCTPLWVGMRGESYRELGTPAGSQVERDLSCCQACEMDDDCEGWAQGTDWADGDEHKCFLKRITEKGDSNATTGIVGARDSDADSRVRDPKPYFTERRNMVCSEVEEPVRCGTTSSASARDDCQARGCCWDGDASIKCFRSKWRPVVIMHGMGSVLTSYEKNILWLREAYPGIYVKNMNVYPGPPGQTTSLNAQMERTLESIRADPMLADGFNFYGESQGGLVARVYVSEHNDPPVYNLVSISGPQAGVGLCPMTSDIPVIKQVCASGAAAVGIYEWPRCSFCEFWKGQNKNKYMRRNRWLKYMNNEVEGEQDPSRAERMKSLNAYMASAASNDEVVQPTQSTWHTFWDWGGLRNDGNLVDWRETESYKGDWLGLKTLDEQGKLHFNMYEGGHTVYEKTWWVDVVQPMFNNTLPF